MNSIFLLMLFLKQQPIFINLKATQQCETWFVTLMTKVRPGISSA